MMKKSIHSLRATIKVGEIEALRCILDKELRHISKDARNAFLMDQVKSDEFSRSVSNATAVRELVEKLEKRMYHVDSIDHRQTTI